MRHPVCTNIQVFKNVFFFQVICTYLPMFLKTVLWYFDALTIVHFYIAAPAGIVTVFKRAQLAVPSCASICCSKIVSTQFLS